MGGEEKKLKKTNLLLSDKELDNLTNGTYRYKCVNNSLLEPFMIPFWNALVPFLPTTLHPNTLTLLGSLSILPSFFLFWWFAPHLVEGCPGWVCAVAVLGVFMFQTLDNLDGRQARRLKLSSPIGDWFDHCLDILSLYLLISQVGTPLFFGKTKYPLLAVLGQLAPAMTHYFTFWDRRFTGEIYLGSLSITEGQFIIMAVITSGWYLGEDFWGTPFHFPSFFPSCLTSWEFIYSDIACFIAGGVFTITTPLEIMTRVAKHPQKLAPLSTAFFRTFDIVVAYTGAVFWAAHSTQTAENTRMTMYTLGLCVTNCATAMLLSSITHGPFRGPFWAPLPWLGALHCYLELNLIPEQWALYGTFVIALSIQLYMMYGSLSDMRGYFQFPLFHVRKNNN